MHNRDLKSDHPDRSNSTNRPGVGAPAKGESSGTNPPIDPEVTSAGAMRVSPDEEATLVDLDATVIDGTPPASSPVPASTRTAPGAPVLQPGDVLGGRYEILQLLGEGGMGAVYKAMDRELDRPVALKLIRPQLAASPAILARFKQELLLARQITHRNVIRIFDLGDADGVKFITMEFVEGEDLRTLIQEKKKFPPEEAVEIMLQVCRALEAAQNVGVIHRDLKPQNIMREKTGRILVMDFGLARTMEGDGMTQTGTLVGTMEYMSPEQALAKNLDQRSDLFTVGLILYELLSGQTPFHAESAIASLIKRNQERAVPVSQCDATIPQALSDIVSKCLEREPDMRFQSAAELLQALEAWQGNRAGATLGFQPVVGPWARTIHWPLLAGIATVLILAVLGYSFRATLFTPQTKQAPMGPVLSLAILPFHNESGDASIDWLGPSLAEMLSTDVGQSAQLRTVGPTTLHQIFTDLRISSATVLDPAMIRRVASFSNADRVVWGSYAKFGDQIRIDATLQDIKNDRSISLKVEVPSEKEIPGSVDQLADSIRKQLALPRNVLKELKASSFQPNSSSVEALRDYNEGADLQRDGKNLEAQKLFEAATKADPNFALAFSKLAQTYSSLGYDGEAEQSAQKAVTLSQSLPEAEKYLISAIHAQVTKNYPAAIAAYENINKASADNTDVESVLASLYKDSGNLTKAQEYYQKLLSSNPKDVTATLEMGRLAIRNGDPQGSLDFLNRAYTLATQVDNEEQKASCLHFMAVAYGMLSKPEESLRNEEQALVIWRSIGEKRGLALSLDEMAGAQAMLGKPKDALANYQESLDLRREIGDKRGLGDTLIDFGNFNDARGDHQQALKMYKEALQVERDLGNESLQAICLNNIGSAYSEDGEYEDALVYYQQALQLREKSKVPQDIVEAVHNLGETSADMGQYDQAVSYYLRALDLRRSMDDRRGAAIESYSLGMLFDYQGRFGAAVNSEQDALKTFRDIKDKTIWMATILGGAAEALIIAGRADEARTDLGDALSLARELKNDASEARALGFQGDDFFYSGNFQSAHASYAQALQAALRSKEPETILIAQANLAKTDVMQKRAAEAIASLRQLIQRANDLGLKYNSVECSIFMAEAMVQTRSYSQARETLQRALLTADKLGMQPLSARAHYLLATIARNSGNGSEAQDNYREALRLLDLMKKDPGAEKLLQRSDFKAIYTESSQAAEAAQK